MLIRGKVGTKDGEQKRRMERGGGGGGGAVTVREALGN